MVHKIVEKFLNWCADNSAVARFERTIVQGVLAVLVTGLTTGEWTVAAITGVIMAVLSPIQAAMGNAATKEETTVEE